MSTGFSSVEIVVDSSKSYIGGMTGLKPHWSRPSNEGKIWKQGGEEIECRLLLSRYFLMKVNMLHHS